MDDTNVLDLACTDDIKPWWIWGYWASPMMYSQQAISINEFLASRWAIVSFLPKLILCLMFLSSL